MDAKYLTIREDLDLLSSDFTADVADMTAFLSGQDTVTIEHGYGGKHVTVAFLIDEWMITRSQNEMVVSLRGRDNMKLALETYFSKTYFYVPSNTPQVISNIERSFINQEDEKAKLTAAMYTPMGRRIPFAMATALASEVAAEACLKAGLKCVWQAPDYPVVNAEDKTVCFQGSVAEVLKKLIEPMQISEIGKVDLFVRGDTVYVKKRVYPYLINHSMSIDDAMIKDFTLKRINYNLPKSADTVNDQVPIKNVYMRSTVPAEEDAAEPPSASDEDSTTPPPPSDDAEGMTWGDPPTVKEDVIETKDSHGNVLTRVIEKKYTINSIVIKEEKNIWKYIPGYAGAFNDLLQLMEDETTLYEYVGGTPSPYQKLLKKTVAHNIRKVDGNNSIYLAVEIVATTSFSYGGAEYLVNLDVSPADKDALVMEDTILISKERNPDGMYRIDTQEKINGVENPNYGKPLVFRQQETIIHERLTQDLIRTCKTLYMDDKFVTRFEQTSAGQLPGPRRVGPVKVAAEDYEKVATDVADEEPEDQKEKDLEIESTALPLTLLRPLARERKVEAEKLAAKKKYELTMTCLPLPWIKKGDGLQLTGSLTDGRGNSLDMSQFVFLITSSRYQRGEKSYIQEITGVAYL